MKTVYAFILIAALAAFSFFVGRDTKHVDPTLEMHYQDVVDTLHHHDTLFRHDTVRVRVAVAKADTVRDTLIVVLGQVDSVPESDSLVPLPMVRRLAQACKDVVVSDSVALEAYRVALHDCSVGRQLSDSARVLADLRTQAIQSAANRAKWDHRRQGAIVGALTAFAITFWIR